MDCKSLVAPLRLIVAPGIEDSQRPQSWLRKCSRASEGFLQKPQRIRFYLKVVKLTYFAMKCKREPKVSGKHQKCKGRAVSQSLSLYKAYCAQQNEKKKKEEISECCKHLNSLSVTFTKSTSKSWGNQIQGFFFFSQEQYVVQKKRYKVKSNLDKCQSFSKNQVNISRN